MFFFQDLLMHFGFLSRWERLLANIHSVYTYTWILIYFTFMLFIYFIVISNIWFCMLDVIIGRHTWNCQIRTHIRTEIHTHAHTKTQKKQKKRKAGPSIGHAWHPNSVRRTWRVCLSEIGLDWPNLGLGPMCWQGQWNSVWTDCKY